MIEQLPIILFYCNEWVRYAAIVFAIHSARDYLKHWLCVRNQLKGNFRPLFEPITIHAPAQWDEERV